MNSKLLSLSLVTMNYLALNAINQNILSSKTLAIDQPYTALVIDNIDHWIEEVDNNVAEEQEIITVLRLDIESELLQGNYLQHGIDVFKEHVEAYFHNRLNSTYAKMLIEIVDELSKDQSLPS
ncbi:hypothetical protein ASD24_24805 [Paenibacillus sp. Root52]|uniref:hypothetical protein n=1 Tax=Paenibacillus sp. Root52 TaxID=1736552 RepID=UPI0006F4CBF8|nr:hypothetical protein [Paenibacillus sp. Root52]KQY91019.1 hypothetical protein ASD24_24805 [Paenibacillus sp. Root52]